MFILIWIILILDIESVNDAITTRIVIGIENETKCFSIRTHFVYVNIINFHTALC